MRGRERREREKWRFIPHPPGPSKGLLRFETPSKALQTFGKDDCNRPGTMGIARAVQGMLV